MGKKIKKGFAGIGDDVFGTDFQGKKAEAAKKQAREQENLAREQARQAVEAARAQALAQQADTDRQRLLAAAKEAEQVVTEAPTVELAGAPGATAARRKKFQSQGSESGGGVSLRL